MRRSRKIIFVTGVVVAVLSSIAFRFWYVGIRPWQQASNALEATATNQAEYPKLLAKWQPSGLVNHFPGTIPAHAAIVQFYEYPGFQQGHADMELKLKLPPAEIAAIESTAQKLAQNIPQNDHLLPMFRVLGATPNAPIMETPPGYSTYFLHPSANPTDENSAGITISTSKNEVIYWATWR
jgi:hypothetical protein